MLCSNFFYTEILTRKVDLWYFFMSEKIIRVGLGQNFSAENSYDGITSVTDMAPSMSCLFAKTTNIAFFNSSSFEKINKSKINISIVISMYSKRSKKTYFQHGDKLLFRNTNTIPVCRVHYIYHLDR